MVDHVGIYTWKVTRLPTTKPTRARRPVVAAAAAAATTTTTTTRRRSQRRPGGASARRAAISMRLRTMLRQLVDSMPLDDMVDQVVCQRFLFDRMPPRLSSHDASRRLTDPSVVTLDSKIRLTSARVARLAIEDGVAAFYFSSHPTRTFPGHEEPQHIDFAIESAPALEVILNSYPKYVTVARLPADSTHSASTSRGPASRPRRC